MGALLIVAAAAAVADADAADADAADADSDAAAAFPPSSHPPYVIPSDEPEMGTDAVISLPLTLLSLLLLLFLGFIAFIRISVTFVWLLYSRLRGQCGILPPAHPPVVLTKPPKIHL